MLRDDRKGACAGNGKCKLAPSYCQGVSDAFWQMIVGDLASSSQSSASSTITDDAITKLDNLFYIFQPKARSAAFPPPSCRAVSVSAASCGAISLGLDFEAPMMLPLDFQLISILKISIVFLEFDLIFRVS